MAIDRYLANVDGFRKYVELLETTPLKKRQTFIDAAKTENPFFVETAEKYMITFERITKLPEMELAEVFGAEGLKSENIATAILSIEDAVLRELIIKAVPRKQVTEIQLYMKEFPVPKPADIGSSRLALILKARELEKLGKLKSIQIPRFGEGYFKSNKNK